MIRVILESPYAGDIERNVAYARACMLDCMKRSEAPYASHLLYTQGGVLRDWVEPERELGIHVGFTYREVGEKTVVYVDFGISGGMYYGIEHAEKKGRSIEYRRLPPEILKQILNPPLKERLKRKLEKLVRIL